MKLIFFIMIICLGVVPHRVEARSVTVVTDSGSYSNPNYGVPEGPWIDLVNAVMKEAGIEKYGIEIHPWARAYNRALTHKNTMILPLARTETRDPYFKWVGLVMPVKFFLVRRKDASRVRVSSLDSARKYQIGVMRDDISHRYLTEKKFTRISCASRMDLLLRMLDGKRVDLICMTRGSMDFVCTKNRVDCSDYLFEYEISGLWLDLYMAFNRETGDDLVLKIRKSLERVKLTSTYADIINRLNSNSE